MKMDPSLPASNKVWRYMSFAKFVWMVQSRSLWLSRADLLGDPWEISLSGEQLQLVIDRHPISPVGRPPQEPAEARAKRIINAWRGRTFINCWNMSEHESNALWNIYCKNSDGVAIQTTIEKLSLIKGPHSLKPVEYLRPGSQKRTPTHDDLVTKKRPMFQYEDEVRIIYFDEKDELEEGTKGVELKFDFEKQIDSIRVHPQAEVYFFDTVKSVVGKYLPNFSGSFTWSEMKLGPPF